MSTIFLFLCYNNCTRYYTLFYVCEYVYKWQVTPIYNRQVSDDVVKCSDRIEDVSVETAEVSSKFKFFETYKPPAVIKKQFRITPPREGQIKVFYLNLFYWLS